MNRLPCSDFSWMLTVESFGYDQGVMGGVIGSSTFVKQFNRPSVSDRKQHRRMRILLVSKCRRTYHSLGSHSRPDHWIVWSRLPCRFHSVVLLLRTHWAEEINRELSAPILGLWRLFLILLVRCLIHCLCRNHPSDNCVFCWTPDNRQNYHRHWDRHKHCNYSHCTF